MALQTFTAGQVLTAAQVTALQTNDFNQTVSTKTASHVLVAADKGTRVEMNAAGATTITVNTSLFDAGDTLFIQNIGAGVCTITAGTATVSTSGSLALIQNAGGTLFFVSAGVAIFYASGVAVASAVGTVRAFVNFNGTGVVAIRASGNVSSITDNGTGDYTVNFTTPLPDANYAAASTGSTITAGGVIQFEANATRTASAYRFRCVNATFADIDTTFVNVLFVR